MCEGLSALFLRLSNYQHVLTVVLKNYIRSCIAVQLVQNTIKPQHMTSAI